MKKKKWSKMLGYAALAATAATAAASGVFFKSVVCRKKHGRRFLWFDAPENLEKYKHELAEGKEWLKEMEPASEYWMIRSHDGLLLDGRFIPAEEENNRVVLAVHGYLATGEKDYAVMARFFHDRGYHVLLIDNRAHGASEGKYVGFGCLEREDCYRWIQYLDKRFGGDCEIFLHGISMGAATVLMTSELNLPPSVKGIVADSAYTSPMKLFAGVTKERKLAGPFGGLVLGGLNLLCRGAAGYRLDDCSAEEAVTRTKIPILFIHGDQDRVVPVEMSRELYRACVSPKELWVVKGAEHGESFYCAREEYEQRVLDFFEKCRAHEKTEVTGGKRQF